MRHLQWSIAAVCPPSQTHKHVAYKAVGTTARSRSPEETMRHVGRACVDLKGKFDLRVCSDLKREFLYCGWLGNSLHKFPLEVWFLSVWLTRCGWFGTWKGLLSRWERAASWSRLMWWCRSRLGRLRCCNQCLWSVHPLPQSSLPSGRTLHTSKWYCWPSDLRAGSTFGRSAVGGHL